MREDNGERLISIECASCGRRVDYGGVGRRPRYCSATCRTRAYELRRAAAVLERSNPMPAVVREVIERPAVPQVHRLVGHRRVVPVNPTSAGAWVQLLRRLEHQARTTPTGWTAADRAVLADALRAVHVALTGIPPTTPPAALTPLGDTAPPLAPSAPPRLSRRQRRALERRRGKTSQ